MKPLVSVLNLQKNTIYTIQKKIYKGAHCEIELEDVRIRVPIHRVAFQKDFIRYNGATIEFLRPTHLYCFCDKGCEECGCSLIPVTGPCMCIFELEQFAVYNFAKFIEKVNSLVDNPNTWCCQCLQYAWDWDLSHIECTL